MPTRSVIGLVLTIMLTACAAPQAADPVAVADAEAKVGRHVAVTDAFHRLARDMEPAADQDAQAMQFIASGSIPFVCDGFARSLYYDPATNAFWIKGVGGFTGLQTYWRGPAAADDPRVRELLEAIFLSRFGAQTMPTDLIGVLVATEPVSIGELNAPPGALARVFDEFITKDDLIRRFGPCAYSEASEYLLAGVIEERLLEQFSESHGIEVTDEEIRSASLAVDNRLVERDDPAWADWEYRIRAWKTAKALYETYGDEVILNFMDQPEPAGAYEAFMKEHEREGSFAILDDAIRDTFWSMYMRRHKPLPADEVDFSRPWCEQ